MNYGQANQIMQQHVREAAYQNETTAAEYQRGNILGSGLNAAAMQEDPKASNRAIPQAFGNLEKDLYSLGDRLNELNNRLRPISRPETPQVEKGLTAGQSSIIDVPLVSAISQADGNLRMSLRLLGDIIERLEV